MPKNKRRGKNYKQMGWSLLKEIFFIQSLHFLKMNKAQDSDRAGSRSQPFYPKARFTKPWRKKKKKEEHKGYISGLRGREEEKEQWKKNREGSLCRNIKIGCVQTQISKNGPWLPHCFKSTMTIFLFIPSTFVLFSSLPFYCASIWIVLQFCKPSFCFPSPHICIFNFLCLLNSCSFQSIIQRDVNRCHLKQRFWNRYTWKRLDETILNVLLRTFHMWMVHSFYKNYWAPRMCSFLPNYVQSYSIGVDGMISNTHVFSSANMIWILAIYYLQGHLQV